METWLDYQTEEWQAKEWEDWLQNQGIDIIKKKSWLQKWEIDINGDGELIAKSRSCNQKILFGMKSCNQK